MLSDSDSELINADLFKPDSIPVSAWCCAGTLRHSLEETGSEILARLKDQGDSAALGLDLSQV